jgi:uncharacterized protein
VTNSDRFVLDINVIVSAVLLPRSVPRQAFDRAFTQGTVLASDAIITELDEVLRRPRFERYVSENDRLQFLEKFIRDAVLIEVTDIIRDVVTPRIINFSSWQ